MSTNNVIMGNQENNINTNVSNTNLQGLIFCGKCGTKLNEDVKFCHNCEGENK